MSSRLDISKNSRCLCNAKNHYATILPHHHTPCQYHKNFFYLLDKIGANLHLLVLLFYRLGGLRPDQRPDQQTERQNARKNANSQQTNANFFINDRLRKKERQTAAERQTSRQADHASSRTARRPTNKRKKYTPDRQRKKCSKFFYKYNKLPI